MLRVGFELTIPVFERAKTVHDLDRAATLIGNCLRQYNKFGYGRSLSSLLNMSFNAKQDNLSEREGC
jgi:hypothetical protein